MELLKLNSTLLSFHRVLHYFKRTITEETLFLQELAWYPGPELPLQITGAEMASVPLASGARGLLLVGGYTQVGFL